ncbi:SDR family NAD(P)-dependent oxidoreductase [Pseudolysinimonas yzui]|uniref:Short-chain dehydrogenase n=1 Tax=Pseudolysinimonas yzui TaxID=2708254 RepID=A0A8J3M2I7_9MICO|nr:SDR family NAD(P)-dependent oxidoreductase [Pseudolysinimonas yzui]GHF23618.1 short-chain dehydrogenase [Pseudolysinimonas yzui]
MAAREGGEERIVEISGKTFVVTGGGNGIGREVVLALLNGGGRVAAVDLREEGLAETAALAAAGDRLSTHAVDISDRSAVEKLPAAVQKAHGAVDGLVNVAGIIHQFKPISELTFDEIERVMNVNFWGTVNTVKTFLPVLRERPAASVVNVSSMGAFVPFPGQSAYGASKAAVKLFTEGLYAELRGTSVAVTLVFPGAVGTNITANSGVQMPGSAGAAQNMKMTTAVSAGAQIVEAIEKGSYKVRIGSDAKLLDRMARLMPQRATGIIADQMKKAMG